MLTFLCPGARGAGLKLPTMGKLGARSLLAKMQQHPMGSLTEFLKSFLRHPAQTARDRDKQNYLLEVRPAATAATWLPVRQPSSRQPPVPIEMRQSRPRSAAGAALTLLDRLGFQAPEEQTRFGRVGVL